MKPLARLDAERELIEFEDKRLPEKKNYSKTV
jgi:hypothetical protein